MILPKLHIRDLFWLMLVVGMGLAWRLNSGGQPRGNPEFNLFLLLFFAVSSCPFWLPCVFVGYALGRRETTPRLLPVFCLLEILAIGVSFAALYSHPGY